MKAYFNTCILISRSAMSNGCEEHKSSRLTVQPVHLVRRGVAIGGHVTID